MKTKHPKKRPIRKSYLLLEVLISLALVTLCLLPLLKPLVAIQSHESLKEREYILERKAKIELNKLKVKLYENQIPWETLEKGNEMIFVEERYDHKKANERYLLLKVKIDDFFFPLLVKKRFS